MLSNVRKTYDFLLIILGGLLFLFDLIYEPHVQNVLASSFDSFKRKKTFKPRVEKAKKTYNSDSLFSLIHSVKNVEYVYIILLAVNSFMENVNSIKSNRL